MARRRFAGKARRQPVRKRRGVGLTLIQRSRGISPAEKAAFHQIDGAGKRHVLREFFGLTAADEQAIVDRVGKAIDEAIKEA